MAVAQPHQPFSRSMSIFDGKSLDEASKNWANLPSILSMRLYEWIGALTHPQTGPFPNGISPRQLDRLAHNQIAAAAKQSGRELKPIWKSNNHLGVMLWNEVKAGRVVRLHKACYVGNFTSKNSASNAIRKAVTCVEPSGGIKNNVRSSTVAATTSSKSPVIPSLMLGGNYLAPPIGVETKPNGNNVLPPPKTGLNQCSACKHDLATAHSNGVLKCIDCAYQTHVLCAYGTGTIPSNLLKRLPSAISNWRCYECKRCHLCGKKDDVNDGLLLCDGCDSGEHMGCQKPALNEVPPAPWFCTICRGPVVVNKKPISPPLPPPPHLVAEVPEVPVERQHPPPPVLIIEKAPPITRDQSPFENSALIIDEENRPESNATPGSATQESSTEDAPSTVMAPAPAVSAVSSPECPGSNGSSAEGTVIVANNNNNNNNNTIAAIVSAALASPPSWTPSHGTVVKTTASPSPSDETPEVGRDEMRRVSDTSSTTSTAIPANLEGTKTLRIRLGKREGDSQWTLEGRDETGNDHVKPPRRRRRYDSNHHHLSSSSSSSPPANTNHAIDGDGRRRSRYGSSSSRDESMAIGVRFDLSDDGGRQKQMRKEKDEIEQLPFMSEDLPLLTDQDLKSIREAKSWTVDETATFLDRMGYTQSAKAFGHEEIDGAALLLLRRQDVLLNLGLKLGPALKTYKFVRYIQTTVRSSA